MSLSSKLKSLILYNRHRHYRKFPLKNKDVTILSNFCAAGAIYNDLGLKFLSPTINLFFGHHSFIDFVNHLEEYKTAELIDTNEFDFYNNKKTPIGILRKSGLPDVELHFLHYNSFEEAKEKWLNRYERIVKNKIYLVIEAKEEHEHSLIDEYAMLPFPKVIFTNLESIPEKSVLHMKYYDTKRSKVKPILSITNPFGRKGYDQFDFVNEIFNRDY